MIQANELRIGNWVKHNDIVSASEFPGTIFKWVYAHWYDIESAKLTLASIDPIPLTPEILEKAGFVLEDDTGYYRKIFAYADSNYPCYFLYSLENEYIQVCRNFTAAADAPCKYLHQLQNLIFALTAQELTINL